jgi:hypothetical protein
VVSSTHFSFETIWVWTEPLLITGVKSCGSIALSRSGSDDSSLSSSSYVCPFALQDLRSCARPGFDAMYLLSSELAFQGKQYWALSMRSRALLLRKFERHQLLLLKHSPRLRYRYFLCLGPDTHTRESEAIFLSPDQAVYRDFVVGSYGRGRPSRGEDGAG